MGSRGLAARRRPDGIVERGAGIESRQATGIDVLGEEGHGGELLSVLSPA